MGRSAVAVIASVVVFGALASQALAKDIHVPGDFRKLEDALAAAEQGDRLFLDRGTFRGPVDVYTPGFEIIAGPRARFVGRKKGGYLASLRIAADDVQVRGLRFVQAGIEAVAERVTVEGCTFSRYSDPTYQSPILTVVGSGAVIKGNRIERTCRSPKGIHIIGSSAQVIDNRVEGVTTTFALRVAGAHATVSGNMMTAPLAEQGITVAGPGATIRENRIESSNLSVLSDEARVEGNHVIGAGFGQASIAVEGSGGVVSGNEVLGGLDTGYLVLGNDNRIADNTVAWNGFIANDRPLGNGFVTCGFGNHLVNDVSDGCAGEAFRVEGNGGFRWATDPVTGAWSWRAVALGAGNTMDGCTGTGAGTCGLGNWTVATEVNGSTFTGNGVDVVSGIDFDLFDGNTWITGGPDFRGSWTGGAPRDTGFGVD